MAQYEQTTKQPKRRSRVGIVLLIILLLLVGTGGYLFYSVSKAPLVLDDPAQLAVSTPMSPDARFRFSAADRTAQVAMDAADIWNLILTQTGVDFLDTINNELSGYSLSVSGCAIHLDEDGLRLDLELFYQDIRLIAKVPCALEISGEHLSLRPSDLKLGMISLPVRSILSSLNLEYDLNLPVLSEVTQLGFTEGAILLTGPMEQDIHSLVAQDEKLRLTGVFIPSMEPLANCLQSSAGLDTLLSHLEQKPGDVQALYQGLFLLSTPEITAEYLENHQGLTERFFPGIDFSAVSADRASLSQERNVLSGMLDQFFTDLSNDYTDKNFRLSGGQFIKHGTPFHAAQYGAGKYDALFQQLDADSFFLVLVDAKDGFIRKTSSFYRMADESQQFTQPVDFNKTYILGCVFRGVAGQPYLMYDSEVQEHNTYFREVTLKPLTEEDVSTLQVPGKFGVWTG